MIRPRCRWMFTRKRSHQRNEYDGPWVRTQSFDVEGCGSIRQDDYDPTKQDICRPSGYPLKRGRLCNFGKASDSG